MSFKGNTKECLSHFIEVAEKLDKNALENLYKIFVNLFGDTHQHLLGYWVNGKSMPQGISLIKLRWFLYKIGYELEEMQQITDSALLAMEVLVYGVIDQQEAAEFVGYSQSYDLYRPILKPAERSATDKRQKKMRELHEICKDEIEKKSYLFVNIFSLPPEVEDNILKQNSKLSDIELFPNNLTVNLLKTLGSISETLKTLLIDYIKASEAERQALREAISKESNHVSMFSISNSFHQTLDLLNALCSERAREEYFKREDS